MTDWPSADASTTNVDSGTDNPRLARADIDDAFTKLNAIIQSPAPYATRADVALATVHSSVNVIQTFGYTTRGDGGGAIYNRVGADPSPNLGVQSGDGAWWELVPDQHGVSLYQGGAVGDGVTDDDAAINAVFSAYDHIRIPAATFLYDSITMDLNGLSGRLVEGESTTDSILLPSGSAAEPFVVQGTYNQFNVFKNFTIDATNLSNFSTTRAIKTTRAWGMSWYNVNVKNTPANARSIYLGVGTYTTEFINCDVGSTTGIIELEGISTGDAVTTIGFEKCSFGQAILDACVNIVFDRCVVQGALNKYDITTSNGVYITGNDIEGTGTYLTISGTVSNLISVGNEFTGFSGTYKSGTEGENSFLYDAPGSVIMRKSVSSFEHYVTAFNIHADSNGLIRHTIENTNTGASSRLDLKLSADTLDAFIGVDKGAANDKGYLDNRTGGRFALQDAGTTRFAFDGTGIGFFNTAPVAKPTVTGSRGGNAALASLLTALDSMGLVTDNTTA